MQPVDTYFGHELSSPLELPILRGIEKILNLIDIFNSIFNSIKDIEEKDKSSGFYGIKSVFICFSKLNNVIRKFMDSIQLSLQTKSLSAKEIIARTSALIDAIIKSEQHRNTIKNYIERCGTSWLDYHQYPQTDDYLQGISKSLKSIVASVIAICEKGRSIEPNHSPDLKLIELLETLYQNMHRLTIFYIPVFYIDTSFKAFKLSYFDKIAGLKSVFGHLPGEYYNLVNLDQCRIDIKYKQYIETLTIIMFFEFIEDIKILNGDISYIDNFHINYKRLYPIDTQQFDDRIITDLKKNVLARLKDIEIKIESTRKSLIKLAYTQSCNKDFTKTFNCVFTQKLAEQMDDLIFEPINELTFITTTEFIEITPYSYGIAKEFQETIKTALRKIKNKTTAKTLYGAINKVSF